MKLSLAPLLAASSPAVILSGWIDEDTPESLRTTTSLVDGTEYHLVMSDEFNVPHRTFADGDDPTWTALDKSDDDYSASGGGSLHFYNSTMVRTTPDGMLTIRSVIEKTQWNHYDSLEKEWKHETKHFKSGMVQTWNKFCFTGGIVEVDVILPGSPDIGGLWPAVWMLGNLGRATYLASTNNLWPWSYDTCDRTKQQSQLVSACNEASHYGLNKGQGRGATEIDIIELMGGDSKGDLPATDPPVSLPYVDMTLQIAPGVPDNRPQSGSQPVRTIDHTHSGFATSVPQVWYDNLTVAGNTSLNPFFYGTYLGETKKGEPVTRNKKQSFQADAVGAMKQVVAEHFKTPHTFRLEWQPGRGGRLDWFTKSYKKVDENGTVFHMEGDGKGQDWEHSLGIPDSSLDELMGSKIPEEPSYVILNTAISSTWAFPYSLPDWCPKCYDCHNPKCACSFNPGFCNMMKTGKVALKIDSVRVYQSKNDDAHGGSPHTVGCDRPEFPTREFIKGNEYKYMRNPPFVYEDTHPLRKVKNGGAACSVDADCGAVGSEDGEDDDWESSATADDAIDLDEGSSSLRESQSPLAHMQTKNAGRPKDRRLEEEESATGDGGVRARGRCAASTPGLFGSPTSTGKRCECNEGYTGPHCLSVDKFDDEPGAYEQKKVTTLLSERAGPYLNRAHIVILGVLAGAFVVALVASGFARGRRVRALEMTVRS